MKGRGSV